MSPLSDKARAELEAAGRALGAHKDVGLIVLLSWLAPVIWIALILGALILWELLKAPT